MHVKRSHESEELIAARNSCLCARLAPIKEGLPVKMFTDNSVETIVFWNTEMNTTLSMPFKSKLSPHRHRVGKE